MEQNTNEPGSFGEYQEVFSKLTKDQLRFVVALQEYQSKKEAAEFLKIPVKTTYNWGSIIDDAVKLLELDILESSRQMRKSALAKAVAVKLAGLDSSDEKVRQSAATEIIEAELGKAKQPIDLTARVEVMRTVGFDTDKV